MLSRIKLWLMRQRLAEFKLRIEFFKEQAGATSFEVLDETMSHEDSLRAAGGNWDPDAGKWTFANLPPQDLVNTLMQDHQERDISMDGMHVSANPTLGLAEAARRFTHNTAESTNPSQSMAAAPTTNALPPAPETRARYPAKKHYHGHRQRLRDRFRHAGDEALASYELLELVLFFCIPRRDVKPLAKSLISRFGSLADVLAQPVDVLNQIPELRGQPAILISAIHALSSRAMQEGLTRRPLLDHEDALHDYVRQSMGFRRTESLHILLLDTTKHLLRDMCLSSGHEDKTPFSAKQIVVAALNHGATSVIMVHNHPSGDPTPSRADIVLTQECRKALETVGIDLIDHLIVARDQCSSLRAMAFLPASDAPPKQHAGFNHETSSGSSAP